MRPRSLGRIAAAAAMALAVAAVPTAPARAASYVPLQGDGSTWAEPAISQWSRDEVPLGIHINFTGDGSAQGRSHYASDQNDFAASDIAFLTQGDPFGGGIERSQYSYSYIPIVAGGTTFIYNLVVGGRKVTNLRLSGTTLARIFTGQITDWSDPAITRDYGARLPGQPITVVTRSDGSGASYMFTRWLSKQYTAMWNSFCAAHGGPATNCGPTEFYPGFGSSIQKNGSDQVAAFLASPIGQGSIGYDEYAYALNYGIPAVKVLNQAGYYSLPSASNVAIALQAAIIDDDPKSVTFLMQNLDDVYTYGDPRAYPLSSYSYLIIPRDSTVTNSPPPPQFSAGKGVTLSTWLNYVLCGAQQKAGQLGYSPLPKNLVVGGFEQVDHMPSHVPTPDLTQLNGCNNPTYSDGVNHLIQDAPMPSPCDRVTAPLNCSVVNGKPVGDTGGGSGPGAAGPGAAGPGAPGAGGAPGTGPGGHAPRRRPGGLGEHRPEHRTGPGCGPDGRRAGRGRAAGGRRRETRAAVAARRAHRPGTDRRRQRAGRRRLLAAAPPREELAVAVSEVLGPQSEAGPARPTPGRPAAASSRQARPAVRAVGLTLSLASLLVLGFFVYLYGLSGLSEARSQSTLYKTLAGRLGDATAPVGPTTEGAPVAIMDVPALGISGLVIVEGTTSGDLMRGPGHVRASVLPGQGGVSVVYGRASGFGGPFAHLMRLQRGDTVTVTTGQGVARYQVESFGTADRPAPDPTADRLVLETADSAVFPGGAVMVSADLRTEARPSPGGRPAITPQERFLAGDPSALIPLALWSQALLLVSAGAAAAALRWSRWSALLCAAPVVFAVTWSVYENLAALLPNLY
jgi:ABC-type phosphate transport system substrate-binding protein